MDNAQILQRALEAWSSGDLDTALTLIDPEIVWVNSGVIPGLSTEYRGLDGVRQFWRDWRDAWEELVIVPGEAVEGAASILVLGRFDGVGRAGLKVSRRFAQVYTFRDGLLLRFKSYPTWEEALAA